METKAMLKNEEMVPGRYLRIQRARRLFAAISNCFAQGGVVQVSTHLRATSYPDVSWFKIGKMSVFARSGKSWVCIDWARVTFHGGTNV